MAKSLEHKLTTVWKLYGCSSLQRNDQRGGFVLVCTITVNLYLCKIIEATKCDEAIRKGWSTGHRTSLRRRCIAKEAFWQPN